MSKRPTPKKRKAKAAGRSQYSTFVTKEMRRLRNLQNSPYGTPTESKNKADKALKNITRIKA